MYSRRANKVNATLRRGGNFRFGNFSCEFARNKMLELLFANSPGTQKTRFGCAVHVRVDSWKRVTVLRLSHRFIRFCALVRNEAESSLSPRPVKWSESQSVYVDHQSGLWTSMRYWVRTDTLLHTWPHDRQFSLNSGHKSAHDVTWTEIPPPIEVVLCNFSLSDCGECFIVEDAQEMQIGDSCLMEGRGTLSS